jgi:hypothetical protein
MTNLPQEAVEAAARAIFDAYVASDDEPLPYVWEDGAGILLSEDQQEAYRGDARRVLEAAAPDIAAQAERERDEWKARYRHEKKDRKRAQLRARRHRHWHEQQVRRIHQLGAQVREIAAQERERLRRGLLSDAAIHALYSHSPHLWTDNDAGPDDAEEVQLRIALEAVAASLAPEPVEGLSSSEISNSTTTSSGSVEGRPTAFKDAVEVIQAIAYPDLDWQVEPLDLKWASELCRAVIRFYPDLWPHLPVEEAGNG